MRLFSSTSRILLFLLVSFWCHAELQAMSQLDKERVKLGIDAAASAAKALKAMKFVSWAAKIGKVAGPILSAVSIVLDIVFMFLNIESPEMILMKSEFKNLNTRLDSFSTQFEEVKKKIDWSTIQLAYEKHESTIHVLNAERLRLTEAQTEETRMDQKKLFLRKFENDFQMASESLYHAMSSETILSDNLFEASRKYTDQHPQLSFHFMQGCAQLLLQAITIQGTYVHVKYNNTHANEYFKKLSEEKMQDVAATATKVFNAMKADWYQQVQRDVHRLAHQKRGIGHNEMSAFLFNYFSNKYTDRIWFAFVYNELYTYEKHAIMVCGGGTYFRLAGRNIVVASQDKTFAYYYSKFSTQWANQILSSFGDFRRDHDGARAVLDKLLAHNKGNCNPAAAIAVVGHGNNGMYINPHGRSAQLQKSVKWCNTNLCWIWKRRYYAAIVFG